VVEYSDAGRGAPIALIHAGGFADWFLAVAGILRNRGFRTVRFRRAGYGDTAPPSGLTLSDHAAHGAAVLDHLEISNAHVVGHSSGALVALDLAASRPDLVERLTLLEPAPGGPFAPPRPPHDETALPPMSSDPFDAFMTMACGPGFLPVLADALGPDGLERARIESSYFLAEEIPAVETWPFDADTARKITQPVTLMCGNASSPFYREVCDRLCDMLPCGELITVDGGDHLYPLRRPAEFAALIAERTDSLSP
jgi:pimeloyl-ACP methyl ester carboxylesterase